MSMERFSLGLSPILNLVSTMSKSSEVNGLRVPHYVFPQGSVLGPLVYVLYTTPVADIVKSQNLQYNFYTDDTPLYVTFDTICNVDAGLSRSRVQHCVADIDRWMTNDKLKLNEDKTELLVISSKYRSRPMVTSIQFHSISSVMLEFLICYRYVISYF